MVLAGAYVVVNGLINDRYDRDDQVVTQAPAQDDTTTTAPQATAQDTTDAQQGQGAQDGTGAAKGQGRGNGAQGATGLDAEVYAHDVSGLSGYVGMSSGDGRLLQMVQSLPLGSHATAATQTGAGTVELTYAYENRDALAHDDDCVDRALVYDVAVGMAAVPDLSTLRVVEEETDPYDYDRDLRVFDRATVERILGLPLTPDLLTAEKWGGVRDQIMGTHAWDAIWESSDVD